MLMIMFLYAEVYTEVMGGCEKPSVLVTSPGSPDVHARRRPARHSHHNANVAGRIQVSMPQYFSFYNKANIFQRQELGTFFCNALQEFWRHFSIIMMKCSVSFWVYLLGNSIIFIPFIKTLSFHLELAWI